MSDLAEFKALPNTAVNSSCAIDIKMTPDLFKLSSKLTECISDQ